MSPKLKKFQQQPALTPEGAQPSKGVVKWFSDTKGFGFIQLDNVDSNRQSPGDIFVHYSSIISPDYKTLREGQLVTLDVSTGPKGSIAHNVVAL